MKKIVPEITTKNKCAMLLNNVMFTYFILCLYAFSLDSKLDLISFYMIYII